MTGRALLALAFAVAVTTGATASAQDDEVPASSPDAVAASSPEEIPASPEEIPAPPPDVELAPATVRFRSAPPGVEVRYLPDPILDDDGGLRVRLGDPGRYATLCTTPCDQELPRGHFGVAFQRGDALRRMAQPLGIDGPTGVRVTWGSRDDLRTAGAVTLAVGLPVGALVALLPTAVELANGPADVATAASLSIGGALLIGALVTGLVLLLMDDDVAFTATPLPDADAGLYSSEWE